MTRQDAVDLGGFHGTPAMIALHDKYKDVMPDEPYMAVATLLAELKEQP
jgi:hypothetical protein